MIYRNIVFQDVESVFSIEISSYRTIRGVLFWYAPYNLPNCVRQITYEKNAPG